MQENFRCQKAMDFDPKRRQIPFKRIHNVNEECK